MDADFVIQNGQIVTAQAVFQADLAVRDGKIAAVGSGLRGSQVYDAQGCLVLPGGVDVHVHPQMSYGSESTGDDWYSASRAAACGGTTTLIDFVEPLPDEPLLEALDRRLSLIAPQAYVDYSLHMTITSAHRRVLTQLAGVVERGVPSFKFYTTYSGFGLSDADLLKALEAVHEVNGLALVHAESDALVKWSTRKLRRAKRTAPCFFPLSRPPFAEVEAVQRVIFLAQAAAARLYLVHLTTAESLQAVQQAQSKGWPVFAETCPQYLLLDDSVYSAENPLEAAGYVCAPPLRPAVHPPALWQHIEGGTIHTIGSDHCAFSLHRQKARGVEDFNLIPPGLPGVEARLSLIYTCGVCTGRISASRWVDLCCTQPARLFGLYPKKGCLQVGSDADIVIFDPRVSFRLAAQSTRPGFSLHEGVDYTPYEGWEVKGWPVTVFLRGAPIVAHRQPSSPHLLGVFLPRYFDGTPHAKEVVSI